MKFTLSWLKEYLETKASAQAVEDALNRLGLVVDSVVNPADPLRSLIIGHILDAKPHPNADKLKVCQVSTGSETLQVVCGAPNAEGGMKVVLALPGTTLPGNQMTLKKTSIRDVESVGMLCSASELNLTEESTGIIRLPDEAPVGSSYAEYAGLDDPIFDIEITPNRGDCLGVLGIARDLAAADLGRLKIPDFPEVPGTFKSPVTVTLKDTALCPLFAGRVIRGVKNGPSPAWLKQKLRAVGVRSISALVDITNYMAYAYGRPMHVFDADKLHGNLTVRAAKGGETLEALDEKVYTLTKGRIVIADDTGPISLAGIMGGKATGCEETTTNVFLESALFDPISIATTGRELGILSDSRYRFERGVDPNLVVPCLEKATQLILDLCGGKVSEVTQAGQIPSTPKTIIFDTQRVKTLGGMTVESKRITQILTDLGFGVKGTGTTVTVTTPSWRFDTEGSADLVEEVCRVVGYDAIEEEALPPRASTAIFENVPGSVQSQKRRLMARRLLASQGMCECYTWSFLDRTRADLFGGAEDALTVVNPISRDLEIMRPSLLANLVAGVARNQAKGLDSTALFEVGTAYHTSLPLRQEMRVAGVRCQNAAPPHWLNKERAVDLYDAKADLFSLLEACGIDITSVQIKAEGPSFFHPGRVGTVSLGPKTMLGVFGELHPTVIEALDVERPVVGFELYLDRLPLRKEGPKKKAVKISPLQPICRDFAFVVDDTVEGDALVKAIKGVERQLITTVDIFDVYQGKGIPDGKKSLALRVTLEPFEKTLTDEEINALRDTIIKIVSTKTGGELRA